MDDTADSRDRAGPLVKPQSRLRCAKGAGLDERPCPVDHAVVSFKPTVPRVCWHRSGIQGGAHAHVRFLIAQTYIRSGFPPYQAPSCVFARVKGSKGMGPILIRGVFQPSPRTVTHPPWIAVFLLRRLRLLSLL